MTIITDAGFRGRWYRQISERGWTYISRVLGRDKKARHEGHFYLYKSKEKGRKSAHPKARARRANLEHKARLTGRFPWLIFTNTADLTPRQVMKLYGRRMQIEQNFRDEKSGRFGFTAPGGWRCWR